MLALADDSDDLIFCTIDSVINTMEPHLFGSLVKKKCMNDTVLIRIMTCASVVDPMSTAFETATHWLEQRGDELFCMAKPAMPPPPVYVTPPSTSRGQSSAKRARAPSSAGSVPPSAPAPKRKKTPSSAPSAKTSTKAEVFEYFKNEYKRPPVLIPDFAEKHLMYKTTFHSAIYSNKSVHPIIKPWSPYLHVYEFGMDFRGVFPNRHKQSGTDMVIRKPHETALLVMQSKCALAPTRAVLPKMEKGKLKQTKMTYSLIAHLNGEWVFPMMNVRGEPVGLSGWLTAVLRQLNKLRKNKAKMHFPSLFMQKLKEASDMRFPKYMDALEVLNEDGGQYTMKDLYTEAVVKGKKTSVPSMLFFQKVIERTMFQLDAPDKLKIDDPIFEYIGESPITQEYEGPVEEDDEESEGGEEEGEDESDASDEVIEVSESEEA